MIYQMEMERSGILQSTLIVLDLSIQGRGVGVGGVVEGAGSESLSVFCF